MIWQIEFIEASLKQLKKMHRAVAQRIVEFMKIRMQHSKTHEFLARGYRENHWEFIGATE